MQKTYVIDTNVLVHDYHSFYKILKNNKIYIPYVVLEELDNLKTKHTAVGVNARHVIKNIEKELLNGRIKIIKNYSLDKPDNQIISACKILNSENPILISKDICLRAKAIAEGIKTEDYWDDKIVLTSKNSVGPKYKYVEGTIIDAIFVNSILNIDEQYKENEAIILVNYENENQKAITIYKNGSLILIDNHIQPYGLKCANLEQQIAVNYILDPSINLISLIGKAGSGKSLISIASALELVVEHQYYKKLTVARPIMPFQKDVGYLAGSLADKLRPWFLPIKDNLEYLCEDYDQPKNKKGAKLNPFEELEEQGILEVCSLTHIRGRSLPNQIIIIDEAQNLTPLEIKTILTRVGENSKIILTGDYTQIDNPYLNLNTNGLIYCVDKFENESIAANIELKSCIRSELASRAIEVL